MKNGLIIGPNSMLGKRLSTLLTSMGWNIFTAGRGGVSDIHLDLRESILPTELPNMGKPCVFHCAASFYDDSPEGSRKNEVENAVSGYLVAELCGRLESPHLIYAGSISSGQSGSGLTSYGASKRRGEEIMNWALSRYGIKFASLRFSQLCDELGECCRHQPWFGRIISYISSGKTLRLPGGKALRNYLYVDDAARIMIKAAEMGLEGVHPVVSPHSITMLELARLAQEVFDAGARLVVAHEKTPFREIFIPNASGTLALLDWPVFVRPDEVLHMIKNCGTASCFGPMDVA